MEYVSNATSLVHSKVNRRNFNLCRCNKGWKTVTADSTSNRLLEQAFVAATGGTAQLTCGDYKIHTFTSEQTDVFKLQKQVMPVV